MSRPAVAVYCASLLLAASGCSPAWMLLSESKPESKQQVVAGSVDQVSARLQALLGHAGIPLTSSREGTEVRLSGITRSGKKFALGLKQQDSPGGQTTVVAIYWDADADETFWENLMFLLESSPPPRPDPSGSGPKS